MRNSGEYWAKPICPHFQVMLGGGGEAHQVFRINLLSPHTEPQKKGKSSSSDELPGAFCFLRLSKREGSVNTLAVRHYW